MKPLTYKAYAKVNLSLQVCGKRPDGFHEISTIFQRISLYDTLTFRLLKKDAIVIHCDHSGVPTDSKNLVYQAASLLKKQYGVAHGVSIALKKRIPVAAGLAGGSTNAAAALQGLNDLWELNLSDKQLRRHGAVIGSDVPFFLYNVPWALGKGRGEQIKPLKIKSQLWHVLIVPKVSIYAKDAYQQLDPNKLTKQNDNVNILLPYLRKGLISGLGPLIFNDLESSIIKIRPSLRKLKQALEKENVVGTIFSGSGPAIFGLTTTQQDALVLKERYQKRYAQVYAVSTA